LLTLDLALSLTSYENKYNWIRYWKNYA